jgi:hypothetical protein
LLQDRKKGHRVIYTLNGPEFIKLMGNFSVRNKARVDNNAAMAHWSSSFLYAVSALILDKYVWYTVYIFK